MTSALIKRDHFDVFDIFEGLFGPPSAAPKMLREDIQQTDEAWIIRIDMPGMTVAVELDGDVLKLSGRRMLKDSSDSIERSFTLPDTANKEGISAVYENGVLIVTVPKRPAPKKPEPRSIDVKVV